MLRTDSPPATEEEEPPFEVTLETAILERMTSADLGPVELGPPEIFDLAPLTAGWVEVRLRPADPFEALGPATLDLTGPFGVCFEALGPTTLDLIGPFGVCFEALGPTTLDLTVLGVCLPFAGISAAV